MKLFVSIIFILFSTIGYAQSMEQPETGKVNFIIDNRLDTLVSRYAEHSIARASVRGYRIQIVASSNRNAVYQVKGKFYNLFKDLKVKVIYQQPNFKLRVGAYRTRVEAYKDLERITPKFNDSFIIGDDIKLAELQPDESGY